MTKAQFLATVKALYTFANNTDHETHKETWTKPSMAHTVCQPLDKMLHDLEITGVITSDERQELYDTL